MNTAELKSDLHRLIVETNNIDILINIRQCFLQLQLKEDPDWWDAITPKQQESIEAGIKQLDEGKGKPHLQVKKNIDQLLGKNV